MYQVRDPTSTIFLVHFADDFDKDLVGSFSLPIALWAVWLMSTVLHLVLF